MAGRKARFRGARHSPKRLESDILDRAGRISEDPEVLRPRCAGNCKRCHFDRTFAMLDRLDRIRDDAAALNKAAAKGGDDIYKAAAAAMSLYAAGGIPYLASAKVGGETVPFAVRGRVGNDKLIAAQHFNDPKLRLFLYNNIAKKKRLHIYSFDDEVVCANRPNMPSDYLYDTFWETPYEFPDDGLRCGHETEGVLVIRIGSLDEEIRICRDCAKDVSTLQYVISRMIAKDPVDDMEVFVEHRYSKDGGRGKDPLTGEVLERYMLGQVTDRMVIGVVLKDKLSDLRSAGGSTFIMGARNYGPDLDGFLEGLKGTELEKRALRSFLEGNSVSVVTRGDKASEALGAVWEEHYRDIISSLTSEDVAEGMGDVSKMNPSQTLAAAEYRFMSADIVSRLPDFGPRAGTVTKAADRLAKAVKVGGEPLLMREIGSAGIKDYRSRSVARAFIMSVSSKGSAGWKFSEEEEDFAEYLVPFVRSLIGSEGEKYRDAMNTLLTASGSGESV